MTLQSGNSDTNITHRILECMPFSLGEPGFSSSDSASASIAAASRFDGMRTASPGRSKTKPEVERSERISANVTASNWWAVKSKES